MSNEYDVVVVGSGIAGCVLTKVLTQAGKRVLLMEAGLEAGIALHSDRAYDTYQNYLQTFYASNIKATNTPYPNIEDAQSPDVLQIALTLGLDKRVAIHTPLMWIDKAQTFALAVEIGGDAFLDLLIEDSHSCYLGDRGKRHDWGYGCGTCPACQLRAQGFAKFKTSKRP